MPTAPIMNERTLFVCGDVMLGRGVDQILPGPCDPTLYEPYVKDARVYVALAERRFGPIPRSVALAYPWGDALDILDAARPDARIINLETSITRSDQHDRDKDIHYRVSPQNAACLSAARIDVCVLGNNHVLDWDEPGLLDTFAALDRQAIRYCGAGRDHAAAVRPAVVDLGDLGRIAVFSVGCMDAGVPPWWAAGPQRPGVHVVTALDDTTTARLCDSIQAWRSPGTVIVVSIHWGGNWQFEVPDPHRAFAHRIIEAGAHLVHGHSSHHVKGIEVHRGQPILYGCGDLLTDYEGIHGHEEYRGDLSLLYLVTLDDVGRLTRLAMFPTRMRRLQIARADAEETAWLAATLGRCGRALGTSVGFEDGWLLLRW